MNFKKKNINLKNYKYKYVTQPAIQEVPHGKRYTHLV